MTDIDIALARLREMPVDPRLASIDAAVLNRLNMVSHVRPLSNGVFAWAALAALTIGIAGSSFPGAPARAHPVAPFGTPPMLAPSNLLSDSE